MIKCQIRWTATVLLVASFVNQMAAKSSADTPNTSIVEINSPRARVVVRRGCAVELRGRTPPGDEPVKISLVCRGKTIVSTECQSTWSVKWDSNKEQADTVYLTVTCILGTGELRQLARVEVNLLTKVPFELKTPTGQGTADDTVTLSVTRTGDLVAKQYVLLVDGSRTDASFSASGSATVSKVGMAPGSRAFAVRVTTEEGCELDTDPVSVTVPARARILPLDNQGRVDLRNRDVGRIVLHLEVEPSLQPTKVAYFVDGVVALETSSAPVTECPIDVRKLASGKQLAFAYVYVADGRRYRSEAVEFEVVRDVKREFEVWYTGLRLAIEPAHDQVEVLNGVITASGGDIVQRTMETEAAMATIQAILPKVSSLPPPRSLSEQDLFTARQSHALYVESLKYALLSMASARTYLDRLRSGIATYGSDARNWPVDALLRLGQARTATKSSLDSARSKYATADGNVTLIRRRLKEAGADAGANP